MLIYTPRSGIMRETIDDILFVCETCLGDNRGDKEQLLSNIVMMTAALSSKFSNNPNLYNALNYFNSIMTSFMNECEAEYQFYKKAIKYLEYMLDHLDEVDEDIIENIDEVLGVMEDLFVTRTISSAQVMEHYNRIIENGILTNSNFFISNVSDRIDEEEKEKLLACIPDIKKEDK